MMTIVGNRGQLWTSALSPHLESPHLDFPENTRPIPDYRQGEVGGRHGPPLFRRFVLLTFRGPFASHDSENNSDHPHPHISKKYAPKICHKMRGRMAYKSLEMKGLSQRTWCTNRLLWHTNSDFYGIRTPTFMPYEPFLLGVGVVFNLLRFEPLSESQPNRTIQCH